MAHIQGENSKLWYPQSTHEKIDSQKMFIDNIVQLEKIVTDIGDPKDLESGKSIVETVKEINETVKEITENGTGNGGGTGGEGGITDINSAKVTYQVAENLEELQSGETMSDAFSKLAKGVQEVIVVGDSLEELLNGLVDIVTNDTY